MKTNKVETVYIDAPSPLLVAISKITKGQHLDVLVDDSRSDGPRLMARINAWRQIGKIDPEIKFSRKAMHSRLIRVFAF